MPDDFIDFKSIDKIQEYLDVHQDKCQTMEFGKKKKVMWASINKNKNSAFLITRNTQKKIS